MAELPSQEIAGTTVDITVDSRGFFTVKRVGDDKNIGYADTLEKALAQARPKIAAAKVKVSVAFIDSDGRDGVATGIHASNGSVLARVGGESVQLNYASQRVLDAEMPRDELGRMLKLIGDAYEMRREAEAIRKKYEINLKMKVEQAIEAAQAAKDARAPVG